MTHAELFDQVPVGGSVWRHWADQPVALLDAAAAKIAAHGANPWVFSADARHFWQFAGDAEKAAYIDLSAEEHAALLGQWDEEDSEPEAFWYAPTSTVDGKIKV